MNFSAKRIRDDPNSSYTSKRNKITVFSGKNKAVVVRVDLIKLASEDKGGGVDNVGPNCLSGVLNPGRVYTFGRSIRDAEFVFDDPRVSKQHCQVLFDGFLKKLYLLNGALVIPCSSNCACCDDYGRNDYDNCVVDEFRSRLIGNDKVVNVKGKNISSCSCRFTCKGNLNGLFVNGVRLSKGMVVELSVGDEVLLVCGNKSRVCSESKLGIGFVVQRIVLHEELVEPGFDGFKYERARLVRPNKRIFALRVSDSKFVSSECDEVVGRARSLLAHCNHIASSHDPVSCIRQCMCGESYICKTKENTVLNSELNEGVKSLPKSVTEGNVVSCEAVLPLKLILDNLGSVDLNERMEPTSKEFGPNEGLKKITPPGKNFYLNRLESVHQCSSGQENVVSLPDLLHPLDSISRMFIATFTSNVEWFLSYCAIPSHLPITIACHNTEFCWSAYPEKRTCVPNPDFPNLILVYPPFPEVIAFGKDRKNKGVGCHHPKLFVLHREDSIRVIITSANLVPKQWKSVTNTVWWQDFPRRAFPDCTALFNKFDNEMKNKSTSDFAAQLAGFISSLITDVPSQAYWIFELTKFDFIDANVHLVASVPGIHSYRSISTAATAFKSKCNEKILGSVVASVVGLSHRFKNTADPKGVQMMKLASYLSQSSWYEMSEIILRREKNIPQDVNAVSVLVSDPNQPHNGDCVQLGFLPRTIAKWVSPLWDAGIFTFHGFVGPQETLAATSGESNISLPLLLHVYQGPNAVESTKNMKPEHMVAFCSLIASLQRCTGLWRLEEVLNRYKWPESLESDFIYGASSIGTSVGAPFMAAFSAAVGKKSLQDYDSQESDPEWGRWNTDHEMKCPSVRIIFPTIERVKSSHFGILPSKYTLSFAEKTWQRLKSVGILHDAVPNPSDRVGHPMHVKVARRRFKTKTGESSGWIYCGSHNISAAAWGRPVSSKSSGLKLHVCNYELGIIFVFPPHGSSNVNCLKNGQNIDDIRLPFVMPAPKYGPEERPATMRAMSEALAEVVRKEGTVFADVEPTEEMVEDEVDVDDEVADVADYVGPEPEEEKAYADVLWHHVDSSQSS